MPLLPLHFGRLVRRALRHRETIAWWVALFPLLFVCLIIIAKLVAPTLYRYAVAENSLVELVTFLAYLAACMIAASLAFDLSRQMQAVYSALYYLLSAGFFIIAMEEISWGQQFFKYSSPRFFRENNLQHETNFHNIDGFPLHNAFILVGLYGAFSRLILPPSLKRRYPGFVDLMTPYYHLFLFFFIPLALYVYYQYFYYTQLLPLGLQWDDVFTDESFIIGRDQEPIELLLGLGFLLFVVANKFRYRRGGAAPGFAPRRAV